MPKLASISCYVYMHGIKSIDIIHSISSWSVEFCISSCNKDVVHGGTYGYGTYFCEYPTYTTEYYIPEGSLIYVWNSHARPPCIFQGDSTAMHWYWKRCLFSPKSLILAYYFGGIWTRIWATALPAQTMTSRNCCGYHNDLLCIITFNMPLIN